MLSGRRWRRAFIAESDRHWRATDERSYKSDYDTKWCHFYSGHQSGRRRHYWGSQVSDSVVCSLSTHRAAATRLQFTWEQLKTNSGMSSTRKNTTNIKMKKKPKQTWTLQWETYLSTKEALVVYFEIYYINDYRFNISLHDKESKYALKGLSYKYSPDIIKYIRFITGDM